MTVLNRSWLRPDPTPFFGISVCRNCGEDYSPSNEEDDLCYRCQTDPVEEGLQYGEYACLNCGRHYTYSPAGPIGVCSSECGHAAHDAIVNYSPLG